MLKKGVAISELCDIIKMYSQILINGYIKSKAKSLVKLIEQKLK